MNLYISSLLSLFLKFLFLSASFSSSFPHPQQAQPDLFVVSCEYLSREVAKKMSCNGCRVLRKGCSESCILRPCLQWIGTPEAQGHATVFVAKFFGRAGLMSFISGVAEDERPALFQSLLFEACGRTVNPVNGAVGLVGSGNWSVCQAAVETVLRGGILSPAAAAAVETSNCYLGGSTIKTTQDPSSTSLNNNNNRIIKRRREAQAQIHDDDDDTSSHLLHLSLSSGPRSPLKKRWGNPAAALVYSEEESSMTSMESGCTATGGYTAPHTAEKKLLNLFV